MAEEKRQAGAYRPLAVVTGASSGIGYELAGQFAQNGFDLLITAEDDGIIEAATRLGNCGTLVDHVQADLSSFGGVELLWEEIRHMGRPVEAVAINAGVGVGGPFDETELEREIKMIELNVVSAVHLAKHVVRGMLGQGHGRILITSSIAATVPAPFEAVYGATKAFLLSFSDALRNELKDRGITVTALMPGPTETNFFHRAGLDDTRIGQLKKDDPADVARAGFEALMAGEAHVLGSSLKTKMIGALSEILPEAVKAEMHRHLSEPGSGKKQ